MDSYKSYLEATQLENKINHIGKNKTDTETIKENHKEFMKSNKSIIKIQQTFKSERYNVFIECFNNIDLSSNNDERMQSIDSIENKHMDTEQAKI